ncbi:MAG: WGR domain-containing protein [Solobacterium sp.]|nr:WGR domain-containing protein [Solobacterium sp.]
MRSDEYKPIYLIMVSADNNNNKYYRMTPDGNGQTWTAEFGRVGANCQKKNYPLSLWDKKYREGYKNI